MPQTMEEWKYLAELYGIGLENARDENAKLRSEVHNLRQKLESCKRRHKLDI